MKNKMLTANSQKLQPKSEANPRRPDTTTERVASSLVASGNETTNIY